MKRLLGVLLVCLCCFGALPAFAVTYPNPQGLLVNDFTSTLDAVAKDQLEKKLRDFEKATTHEFAVVIVPDLQGENVDAFAVHLFAQWGIGKKGKDNGLLLLVAKKERKWRFEVGNGLEGVLTDAQCGRIGRELLVPHFKKGEFGIGIDAVLTAAMNIAAPPAPKVLTPQELQQKAAETKAAHAAMLVQQKADLQRKEARTKTVWSALLVIFFFFLSAGGIYLFVRTMKKVMTQGKLVAQKQLAIKTSLEQTAKIFKEISGERKAFEIQSVNFPPWVEAETKQLLSELTRLYQQQDALRTDIRTSSEDFEDLENGMDAAKKIERLAVKAGTIMERMQEIPENAAMLADKAKKSMADLASELKNILEYCCKMKEEGYRFDFDRDLAAVAAVLQEMPKKLEIGENPDEIIAAAARNKNILTNIEASLKKNMGAKALVDEELLSLPKTLADLLVKKNKTGVVLEQLKKQHAEAIWQDLNKKFLDIEKRANDVEAFLSAAKISNSMQEQRFLQALEEIGKASKMTLEISTLLDDVENTYLEAENARINFNETLKSAEQAVLDAKEEAGRKDVGSKRVHEARLAEDSLQQVKRKISSGGIINWLETFTILSAVIAASAQISKLSLQDIAEAASARAAKILRQQEAQEATERAARRRREDDDRSSRLYNSNSSDSSSSSSSDSSFSFGGGGSSGGGASGDW